MFSSTKRIVLTLALFASLLVVGAASGQAATPQGTVGIDKAVVGLTGPATPGEGFSYQLTASCSSLTVACEGATVTDVLPTGLTVTDLPTSSRGQTVSFNATSRVLSVTFTQPLPAPNPVGSTGLLAGSVSKIYVGVQLPTNTTAPDGSSIINTATIDATNAAPASDSATVVVSIPRRVSPVATKTWPDSNAIAQSGEHSTITVGVRNNSSRSAQVSRLTVADTSTDTFNTHDLVSLGTVLRFPAGADQLSPQVCTQPLGTPCAESQWIAGPATAGPLLNLPSGVNATSVTGVRFVFSNSAGSVLAPDSSAGGQVSFVVALRDTSRSTGATLDPTSSQRFQNCAVPSALDPVAGVVTASPACVPFTVLSRAITLVMSKRYFSDSGANYTALGTPIAGQSSPVSALVTATNTSSSPVPSITITEPSALSASDFSALDVSSLRLQFPSGATAATVVVSCRDGSTLPPVALTSPPATVTLANTGCPLISPPAKIVATFTGQDAQGQPTIASGAAAVLGVHGTLNSLALAGAVSNCADGLIISPASGQGSASGSACANVQVAAPATAVSGGKSSTGAATGGQLVPGQPLTFTVRGTNSGNLPQAAFSITDPPSPTAPGNPFDVVALTSASLSTTYSGLAARFAVQVYDSRTNTWVAYDGTDAALLDAARGIRAVLQTGTVPAGAGVYLGYVVQVRPGVAPGATLHNCQLTTASSGAAAAPPVSVCRSGDLAVTAPNSTGAIQKAISPATLARSIAGVAPQTTQVRIKVQNTGNIPLRQIVVSDTDAAFFDAVNLTALDAVNFPPGANRVQVDTCSTDCAGGSFTLGVPASTAVLPSGVAAATVQGLRFTFTASAGGYLLNPGSNFPSGGACPSASVCFHVAPRVALRSQPTTLVADSLSDTATAAGESELQSPGSTYSFGDATATLNLAQGTPALDVNKTPTSGAYGAGDLIPFTLNVRNSGTGVVPDLVVSDPVPAGLVFNDTYAGDAGRPFTLTSNVPALPTPTFSVVRGNPSQPDLITALRWSFPGFAFTPGSTIAISYQDTLAPGFSAGSTETNTFGAGSDDVPTQQSLVCTINSSRDGQTVGGVYGAGRYCTSSATVLSRGGTDVDAQKWVTGDASLGFYNTATGSPVKPGDIACPLFTDTDGTQYTRYPCVAEVLAGQQFKFRLRVINVGNTPVTQVRLADGLPHTGDTGVKLTDEQRATEWAQRPVLAAAPTLVGPGSAQFAYTSQAQVCTNGLQRPATACPTGDYTPTYSSGALGFQAFVTFPATLAPGASFSIAVPMQAPATLSNPADSLPIAWNSFAHTDFVLEPGQAVPVQLPLVEPPKVGVALPFGLLQINKTVSGDLPDPSVVGPFQVAYSCTVTPVGGSPVSVAAGSGTFSVASPLVVANVPVGAQCAVWETDTAGGTSDHTSPASAVRVRIAATPGQATGVTLNNAFFGSTFTVTKRVVNGGAGPYSFTMNCTLGGQAVRLPAATAAFTLAADQTRAFAIPIGSVCVVTEVNLPNLDTVLYGTSTAPIPVTVTANTSETITNQFPQIAIAPPPPPSTPSPVTGTPSTAPTVTTNSPTLPNVSAPLAATGANVGWQALVSLWLLVLGALLVTMARRRRT